MLADMAGLALTLLGLALLAAGGYLAAVRLLDAEAGRDPLALAIASLLAAFAEAVGIGLLLGAAGLLRVDLGFAAQALLVAVLARGRRGRAAHPVGAVATAAGLWEPARQLARHSWERLREHPALSLLTANAVAGEALRGLLRPPLSWDSLMYHLLLTASWVQGHDLAPVFGGYPVNDYGFVPANGSIWLWWWMAPSHSELYVNLAALPHWVLLGLAVGGVARQLGARRHWPLAAFLALLTPTVVRFAATQYVDILVGATLLAACFFALRWMERPCAADAVLAGAGLGLACGAKILGAPYALTLAAAVALLTPWARGGWRLRLAQAALALLLAAGLGSYFYVRNVALGAGPLALGCEGREALEQAAARPPPTAGQLAPPSATAPAAAAVAAGAATARTSGAAGRRILPILPRPGSVVDLWAKLGGSQLLDVFFGVTRPQSVELAVGPQALVLLAAFLALPFGVAAQHRRAALVAASQIAFELSFWLVVPYSGNQHVFANVRYLIPAFGLAFAGGVAVAERLGMSALWLRGIALVLACQSLLQLHAEMPSGVRVAIAAADAAAVALAVSSGLRGALRHRAAACAAAALLLALLGAPLLARFRAADRPRALASEWTAHSTSAHVFAGGWGWLDAHGDGGAVDAVGAPGTYFVYPAMGAFLQRRAHYVNINRADHRLATRYPGCNPRVDPSPQAWLDNVARSGVRWLLLYRYPEFDFPVEGAWAHDRPDRFALRYEDLTTVIFEVLPAAAPAAGQPTG
jgi:hypothetical protein